MAAHDLIDMYLAHLRERSCTEATLDTYLRHLSRADRELPFGLDIANANELRLWLWRDGLEPATRATYDAALRGFFTWAFDTRKLTRNPMEKMSRPKVPEGIPRVAGDEAVRWAVTQAPEPYRLWAILAAYQGLRCIEVSRLHREHVTHEETAIYKGKGNKAGWVPTHPLAWAAIQDLPPGPITDLEPKRISDKFIAMCHRNGIYGLSMHPMRGWYASLSYDTEHDLLSVQQNMRHTKPGTTARYIRRTNEQRRAAIAGLPVFA